MQNTAWGSHLVIERAQLGNLSLPPQCHTKQHQTLFHRGGSKSIYSRVTRTIEEANKFVLAFTLASSQAEFAPRLASHMA